MKAEDEPGYILASVFSGGATVFGYLVPIAMPIVMVCLLLVVGAGLLGDRGGAMAKLVLRPFVALGQWLAQKDDYRLVRLAPVFGLIAGWLIRRSTNF